MDSKRIFEFLSLNLNSGKFCVLTSILSVEGSSMRDPGAHLGVAQDGNFSGSLSGGCIEQAVVAEALEVLKSGQPRVTRFGAGSPYIDIKLPCGGGLDIHFLPLKDTELMDACLHRERRRQPFAIQLPLADGVAELLPKWQNTAVYTDAGYAAIGHMPSPRLMIVGHGAAAASLARLAREMCADVEIHSPDARLLEMLSEDGFDVHPLKTPDDMGGIAGDPWTAFTFLFHDHDWEPALMAHALSQPHFYIGAMGGRQAHALRRDRLQEAGVSAQQIDSIAAPVGLFHSVRDPGTLALSALAEVVKAYQQADFEMSGG